MRRILAQSGDVRNGKPGETVDFPASDSRLVDEGSALAILDFENPDVRIGGVPHCRMNVLWDFGGHR
jgi:hypothetical protein